jgi:multidrug resistance efflux pump
MSEDLPARVAGIFRARREQRELRAALTQLEADIERCQGLAMRLSEVVERIARIETLDQASQDADQLGLRHPLDYE